jgi:outer membrane protein assembly factor BamB
MGRRRPARRTVAALGLALLAPGCFWSAPGQGPDRRAHNTVEDVIGVDTVADLQPLWSAPVAGGVAGDPVTSAAGVHVAGRLGLHAFAAGTGTELWRHEVAEPAELRQPWVVGDRVVVGRWEPERGPGGDATQDRTLVLDSATGAPQEPLPEGVVAAARGDELLLWDNYTSDAHGRYGWYARTGLRNLATGEATAPVGPTGGVDWVRPFPPPGLTLGPTLAFASDDHELVAYRKAPPGDPACGGVPDCAAWRAPVGGVGAPVLGEDGATVYAVSSSGVAAVGAADGAVRWQASSAGRFVTATPALADGVLYVPTYEGDLLALDAATGATLWVAAAGTRLYEQPAVAGGVVFVASGDGTLSAFAAAGCGAATCPPLWSTAVGTSITGAPAVSDGRVYVGTADGRLVAFGLA